ncbi:MAG: hypothetical protein WC326_05315 [Candidatus Delongbacteria bacterium]
MSQHVSNQRKTGLLRKLKAGLLPLLTLLGGCVYSLQPWYPEGTGGAEPALRGVWREAGGQDTWVFLANGDSLRLLYQEDNQSGEFFALNFRVGENAFLDLSPVPGSYASGPVSWYLLPLHGLHRWTLDQDTLRLSSLNPQSVELLLEGTEHPRLEKLDNRLLFLGSREEMADFLESRLQDPALYDEPTVLVRE